MQFLAQELNCWIVRTIMFFLTGQTPSIPVLKHVLVAGISLCIFSTGILYRNMLFWELRQSRGRNQNNAEPFLLYSRKLFYKSLITCAYIHIVYRADSK